MPETRREIRIKVLQTLYAFELSGDSIQKVKKDLLSYIQDSENIKFANELIDSVINNIKELDHLIEEKIDNWEIERIAILDKIILRIGLAELLYFPEIPPKVTINEAIDISKDFCSKNSGKFINGILDALYEELKNNNKLNKTGRGLLNLTKKSKIDKNPET